MQCSKSTARGTLCTSAMVLHMAVLVHVVGVMRDRCPGPLPERRHTGTRGGMWCRETVFDGSAWLTH